MVAAVGRAGSDRRHHPSVDSHPGKPQSGCEVDSPGGQDLAHGTGAHGWGAAEEWLSIAVGEAGAARQPHRPAPEGRADLPAIVGYEDTVIPQIENAILSGQDIVFLGERGQAKTRMARLLVELLDEEMPDRWRAARSTTIRWPPSRQAGRAARRRARATTRRSPGCRATAATARSWPPRHHRSPTSSARSTPSRWPRAATSSDELTIHYGLLPRTNRGIFAINELPDLAERIQVGLLNIIEERDVQIRGYKVRLPLDLFVVASANPEDYTNRGRIITPLKDRFGSPDPHALSAPAGGRDRHHGGRAHAVRQRWRDHPDSGLHAPGGGGADPAGPQGVRDQPALAASPCG